MSFGELLLARLTWPAVVHPGEDLCKIRSLVIKFAFLYAFICRTRICRNTFWQEDSLTWRNTPRHSIETTRRPSRRPDFTGTGGRACYVSRFGPGRRWTCSRLPEAPGFLGRLCRAVQEFPSLGNACPRRNKRQVFRRPAANASPKVIAGPAVSSNHVPRDGKDVPRVLVRGTGGDVRWVHREPGRDHRGLGAVPGDLVRASARDLGPA